MKSGHWFTPKWLVTVETLHPTWVAGSEVLGSLCPPCLQGASSRKQDQKQRWRQDIQTFIFILRNFSLCQLCQIISLSTPTHYWDLAFNSCSEGFITHHLLYPFNGFEIFKENSGEGIMARQVKLLLRMPASHIRALVPVPGSSTFKPAPCLCTWEGGDDGPFTCQLCRRRGWSSCLLAWSVPALAVPSFEEWTSE